MTETDAAARPGTGVPPPTNGVSTDAARLAPHERVDKWDRPPPPRDWRWWVGTAGKVMIAIGLLMFGFVAYQLWGTGIETARAQRALERDFREMLAAAPPIDPAAAVELGSTGDAGSAAAGDSAIEDPPPALAGETDTTEPGSGSTEAGSGATDGVATTAGTTAVLPVEAQNLPAVENGEAIGRIEIPAIGVDDIVVAGVTTSDLKKGPGHFPYTPLPGQLGNAAIAGHRTTHGQPFFDVDKLVPGDEIVVTTLNGRFVYRVTGQEIVAPSAGHVVATTDPTRANLTLTSCHPKWTARQRIVIFSELDAAASSVVGAPTVNYGQPIPDESGAAIVPTLPAEDATGVTTPPPADAAETAVTPASTAPAAPIVLTAPTATVEAAEAFGDGWFADPAANPHVLFWGVLLALIGIGAYLLSRRVRRDWVGAIVGVVPFFVALYFFFQNVNRLLPPNL